MDDTSPDQTQAAMSAWLRRASVTSLALPAVSIPIVVVTVLITDQPWPIIAWAFWFYVASTVFGLTTAITVWFRRAGNFWLALIGTVLSAGCGLVAGAFWVLGHIPVIC